MSTCARIAHHQASCILCQVHAAWQHLRGQINLLVARAVCNLKPIRQRARCRHGPTRTAILFRTAHISKRDRARGRARERLLVGKEAPAGCAGCEALSRHSPRTRCPTKRRQEASIRLSLRGVSERRPSRHPGTPPWRRGTRDASPVPHAEADDTMSPCAPQSAATSP